MGSFPRTCEGDAPAGPRQSGQGELSGDQLKLLRWPRPVLLEIALAPRGEAFGPQGDPSATRGRRPVLGHPVRSWKGCECEDVMKRQGCARRGWIQAPCPFLGCPGAFRQGVL